MDYSPWSYKESDMTMFIAILPEKEEKQRHERPKRIRKKNNKTVG